MERANYRNRRSKEIELKRKKQNVLAVLLAASIGLSSVYGLVEGTKNLVGGVKNAFAYDHETDKYFEMVQDNTHVTDDRKNVFINPHGLADDVKKLYVWEKDDLYHHLIGVAQHIQWNKNTNFNDLVRSLELDKLAKENPNYPTTQDLHDFLIVYDLLNEDGTIDFEAWKDYDKAAFSFENKMKGK